MGWVVKLGAILASFVVMSSAVAGAAVWTVDCDPADSADFLVIQSGVNAAAAGDSVLVGYCSTGPYSGFQVAGKVDVHVVAVDDSLPSEVGANPVGVGTRPTPSIACLGGCYFNPRVEIFLGGQGTGRCVEVSGSTGVSISGFLLTECQDAGVWVENSVDTVVANNRIDFSQGTGIEELFSSGSTLTGNMILGAQGNAIDLVETAEGLVTDNWINQSGLRGIEIENTTSVQVLNNAVNDSGTDGVYLGNAVVGARVERNRVTSSDSGCDIHLFSALGAQVLGNFTTIQVSACDFGLGSELFGNVPP